MRASGVVAPDKSHRDRSLRMPHDQFILDRHEVFMERFLAKIEVVGECWLWIGAKQNPRRSQPVGYGVMVVCPRPRYAMLAHRLSWVFHHGLIPEGLGVLHKCDNPPCVNPDHHFLGDQKDNMEDCVTKGRKEYGENHSRATLTESKVLEIRRLADSGVGLPEIASRFNSPHPTIWAVAKRKSWRYLPEEYSMGMGLPPSILRTT